MKTEYVAQDQFYWLIFSPFIILFLHLLTSIYIARALSPYAPTFPTLPHLHPPNLPPLLPRRTCSALFSDFVEEKT
jgi:hypothetical protein